jgi:formylmethanofuran dehydrogenase subunit C
VPATVTWTNAAGGAWDVPGNWNTNALPGAADDVVIPDLPGDVAITHATGTDTIRSLTSQEAIVLSGGSLTIGAVGATSRIQRNFTVSGGTLELNRATLEGPGLLTNAATLLLTGSTVNAPLTNQGTLLAQAVNTLGGALTTAAGSTLRVLGGSAGDAALTVASGFTNHGALELTSADVSRAAALTVSSGTLTNALGASVSAFADTGGTRILGAQLDNQGTLNVAQDLSLTSTGHTLSNSGTIDIASGFTLTVGAGSFTNFSAGTLTGGTYNIAGTFKFPEAALTTNAAALLLDGPNAQIVNLSNVNALTNFATNTAAGSFTVQNGRSFTTGGAFTNAGNLNIAAGGSFTTPAAAAFSNTGTLFVGAGGTVSVAGTFTNFAGTTLTGGTYVIAGTLKFAGADIRTNAATVFLDGAASQIINQADANGLANFAANAAEGTFGLENGRNLTTAGAFSNAGSLSVGSGSTFTTAAAAAFSNTGTLTIGTGGTFTVAGTFSNFAGTTLTGGTYLVAGKLKFPGADLRTNAATLVLDGPAGTVVNEADANALANFAANAADGTLSIENGRSFTTGGAFSNAGTLMVGTGSSFTTPAAAAFSNTGTLSISAGGTVSVTGTFTNFAGTTLTGGTYIVAGTLRFAGADVRTNAATVILHGPAGTFVNQTDANALANFTTNAAEGSFQLESGRSITVPGPFTNAGTLSVGAGSTFAVTGSLTNFAGTTLTGGTYVLAGTLKFAGADVRTNAARIVLTGPNGQIVNQADANALANLATNAAEGIFRLENGRSFTAAGAFTNAGSLIVGAGSTFTSAAAAAFTNAGTLSIGADGTVSVAGTFTNFAGTTLTGGTYLVAGTLKFAGADVRTNAATIVLDGPAGAILNQADANGLANFATNAATGVFVLDNGRSFTLAGAFTNAGGLAVAGGSTFTLTAAFTNAGTLTVGAGSTLAVTGSLTNFAGTTLTGGTYVLAGTLKFAGADVRTNAATIILDGPAGTIVNQADVNALTNIATNAAGSSFSLENGRSFTTAGPFTNAGSLSIGAGSSFTTAAAAAFSNAGTLFVGTGGTFTVAGTFSNFAGTTLTGGTYILAGTLKFAGADVRTNAATIILDGPAGTIVNQADANGLANFTANAAEGTFSLENGRSFTVPGPFTNAGTLLVGVGSTFAVTGSLTNFAGTTLTGGTYVLAGTLKFAGADVRSNAATLVLDGPGSALVNEADANGLANLATNTTMGSFSLENGRSLTTPGAFANAGGLAVGNGSTFTVTGRYTQTGGSTTLRGGTLTARSGATTENVEVQAGVLDGFGTLNAHLVNAGEVNPGGMGGAGLLTVTGNYTQTATGILNLELGGPNAGTQYDRLNISGTAALDGTLNLSRIGGFMPAVGDSFQVLLFGTRSGNFVTVNGLVLGADLVLELTFGTGLTLVTKRPPS